MEENVVQINGGIMVNVDVSVKNVMYVKKIVWNHSTCDSENEKYLGTIIYDSAIMCNGIIESYKENAEAKSYNETNFNEKRRQKHKNKVFILHYW